MARGRRHLIQYGAYFRGKGAKDWLLRKVLEVSSDGYVWWCDFAGPGECRIEAFASWMGEYVETPTDEEKAKIEKAFAEHRKRLSEDMQPVIDYMVEKGMLKDLIKGE